MGSKIINNIVEFWLSPKTGPRNSTFLRALRVWSAWVAKSLGCNFHTQQKASYHSNKDKKYVSLFDKTMCLHAQF